MNEAAETFQKFCPQCGGLVDADARFCKHCAFDLTKSSLDSDTTIVTAKSQPKTNPKPILLIAGVIAGAAVIGLLIIGLIGTYLYKRNRTQVDMSSASPTPATTPTMSDRAKQVEEKILRGETLSDSDISGLSAYELRVLRNVHFARYGRKYEKPGLGDYFYTRPWYKPNDNYADTMINATDKANIDLIVRAEKGESSSSSSNDTADGENDGGEVPSIELEAQREANKFWEKRYKRCGDSYFQHLFSPFHEMSQTPPYEIFVELKGANWNIDGVVPEPKTEAERLNQRDNPSGIAWQGKTMIYLSVIRYWASRDIDDAHAGWNPWKDKSGPFETFQMVKKNGTWTFDGRGWYNISLQNRPVFCNEIPKQ